MQSPLNDCSERLQREFAAQATRDKTWRPLARRSSYRLLGLGEPVSTWLSAFLTPKRVMKSHRPYAESLLGSGVAFGYKFDS